MSVNPAVAANLERVLASEQRAAAERMAKVRVIAAGAGAAIVWVPIALGVLTPETRESLRPTSLGALGFFALAVALLVVTQRFPGMGKWASLATPLVDVPVISLIQHLQQGRLPEPWEGIPTNVAFMCGFVTLAALSLSRAVVFTTAVVATLSIELTLYRAHCTAVPMALTALVPVMVAWVAATLVVRVRSLVHDARRRDLVGKYILGQRLGLGGMAEVFLATYSPEGGFERTVAVKRILPSIAQNADAVALFRREAELGAMLAHPNIVQVLDFGSDGETYFLAMEHVDGLSLGRVLAYCRERALVLPLVSAVYVARMLCDAVEYIHSRTSPTGTALNLVHRDINPPNVLISKIGEVKLGDFGIARAATQERLTETGIIRGKVGYAAPEQLLGQPYDSRADEFALGVTLHELFTGQYLFRGDSDLAVMRACLDGPIPTVSSRRPVPAEVDEVVAGLLERDVEKRLDVGAVARRLHTLPVELLDDAAGRRQLGELVSTAKATQPALPEPPATPSAQSTAVTAPLAVPSPSKDTV